MIVMLIYLLLCILLPIGCMGVMTNAELEATVSKLTKEIKNLKSQHVDGACETRKRCGACLCINDISLTEKFYCDCRRLPAKRDCKTFWLTGNYVKGIYSVTMNGLRNTNVFCDGFGWTVIQRRINGATNFYRSWQEYKRGFGTLQGEFWLGNDNIYALTTQALYPKGSELLIRMKSRESWNIEYIARYKQFQIDSELANYKLHVKYDHGNGDSLSYHDNKEFSTFDKDNDKDTKLNCARKLHGGWWYGKCAESNLNGEYDPYEQSKPEQRIDWESLLSYRTQAWVEMKVKRL